MTPPRLSFIHFVPARRRAAASRAGSPPSASTTREEGWLRDLAACGWADTFRERHRRKRAYTWYSPNGGNGFRLDQVFVNRALLGRLGGGGCCRQVWGGPPGGGRRDALSDHAALLVDLDRAAGI